MDTDRDTDKVRLPITVRVCEGCGKRRVPTGWRLCERCQDLAAAMAVNCFEP